MATCQVTRKLADNFQTWFSEGTWQWYREKYLVKKDCSKPDVKLFGDPEIKSKSLCVQSIASPSATSSSSSPCAPDNLTASQQFEIKVSPKGGYGTFATQPIPIGSIILREPPLIEGKNSDFLGAFSRLSAVEKDLFMSLYGYDKIDADKVMAIFKTNRFVTPHGNCGIFLTASRFNHSCVPQCVYYFDEVERELVVKTIKPIARSEEITISYGQCSFDLLQNYGFICDCGNCSLPINMEMLNQASKGPDSLTYYGTDYSEQWRMSGYW